MDPIVSEEHSCEDNELENTVVYHACAVTLSMEKPLEEEEPLKEKCKDFQYLIVLLYSMTIHK
jgi:hypothetical protein